MMASTQDQTWNERDDDRQPDSGLPGGGAAGYEDSGDSELIPPNPEESPAEGPQQSAQP